MKVERADTWASSLDDKPGALAKKLKMMADAGVNLELVIARRAPDQPGSGVVFVAPVTGAADCRAARHCGFERSKSLHSVRIEGPDRKGQGARMTSALAAVGISLRGLSAASIGKKFVAYVALDTASDAAKAARVLAPL